MLYKQANNTYKTKQNKKTDIFIQVMVKHAHTGSRAYCYTVHNLCKCPRRLFTTTVVVDVQQDHSLKHCIQLLSTSNKNIPYYTQYAVTVNVQQNTSLL